MSQTTINFLNREFPGTEQEYFELLLKGINKFSKGPLFQSDSSLFHQLATDDTGSWHLHFKGKEVYYRAILQLWPTVFFFNTERLVTSSKSFDDYLTIYFESGCGLFLANTKMLTTLYEGLVADWNSCYSSWINGNTRILLPYTPLDPEKLEMGIRNTSNQIIVNPDKYHGDISELSHLIKRQYQLALTEQNR